MNLDDVPSVRRNPVVADIFTQLGYMERKGSGFGKIINPIKMLPYFSEKMLPSFFSDRAQFTITFPNIAMIWKHEHPNFDILVEEMNGTQGGTQDGTQDDLDKWIENQVINNPKVTTEELAELSN